MTPVARRWTRWVSHGLGTHPWWASVLSTTAALGTVVLLTGAFHPGPGLEITGTTSRLLPGVPGRLHVLLHNPGGVAVTVTSVQVQARDASPECAQSNLAIASFDGTLTLRPHGVRTIALSITLDAYAPEACRRVVFPLKFTGRAVGP